MRKLLAGLIAGLLLGATGTAISAGYWQGKGRDYRCDGVPNGAICKTGGYELAITRNYVSISQGKLMFGCRKWESWASCFGDN